MNEHNMLKKLDIEFFYTAEMDEFWSFVETKSNQRWTWYAMDKNTGIILAWYNGNRSDDAFLKLYGFLSQIPIRMYFTDEWGAYQRYLPQEKHYVGKDMTWKIERKNLNFRTHIKRLHRKTICYSKDEEIHDNVIGMYIERFYFKSGTYMESVRNQPL